MTTATIDNVTYEVPEALEVRSTAHMGAYGFTCKDCNKWDHAGRTIRHSKHCDTSEAQAIPSCRKAPILKRTKKGEQVVKGCTADVYPGAVVEVNGSTFRVDSVGKTWTESGVEVRYGYFTTNHNADIVRAVREGDAQTQFTDDEIYDAYACGWISASAAMNQD